MVQENHQAQRKKNFHSLNQDAKKMETIDPSEIVNLHQVAQKISGRFLAKSPEISLFDKEKQPHETAQTTHTSRGGGGGTGGTGACALDCPKFFFGGNVLVFRGVTQITNAS